MKQPVRREIKEKNPECFNYPIYTLLIDGNNLLNISMVDTKVNNDGEHVGGIFQFLLQLKLMLNKKDWDYVYVMWDGVDSGILRYDIYPEYKEQRGKNYANKQTDYDQKINDFVKRTIAYSKNKQKAEGKEDNFKDDFDRERTRVQLYLEELFVRQIIADRCEGDDLIAYYVKNRVKNEKIIIMSSDGDMCQLINEDVAIYNVPKKKFITHTNHLEEYGIIHQNVVTKKILCGDVSDNIKGIKQLAEPTLLKLFPKIKTTPITIEEIIEEAKIINKNRVDNKQKPLAVCDNIINCITNGSQGEKLYEINNIIINLDEPLLTEESIMEIKEFMNNVIDPADRSSKNLYKYVMEDDIHELLTDNKFTTFFGDFKRLENKEIERFEKVSNKNFI